MRLHCLMLQYASVTARMNLGTSTAYPDIGPFPSLSAHASRPWHSPIKYRQHFLDFFPDTCSPETKSGPTLHQPVINQHQACTLASHGTGPTHWHQTSCMISQPNGAEVNANPYQLPFETTWSFERRICFCFMLYFLPPFEY